MKFQQRMGRKAPRMVTGFGIFRIIPSPSLSANAHFAFISTAAVDFCLIGEYLDICVNWKRPNLKPGF